MKITELIVILAEYIERHGNLEVTNYGSPLAHRDMFVEENEHTKELELRIS